MFFFCVAEMTHKIRSRPDKRVGGGGYGHHKTMNKDDKQRRFKQVNRDQSRNGKKFEK